MSCNERDRWTETKEKYVDNLETGNAEGRRNKNKHIGDLIEILAQSEKPYSYGKD